MKNNDPFTRDDQTRFTMRINSELLEKIKVEAEKSKRSTAKQIEFILEQYVATLSKETNGAEQAAEQRGIISGISDKQA